MILLGIFTFCEGYIVSFIASATGYQQGNSVVLLAAFLTMGKFTLITQPSSSPAPYTPATPRKITPWARWSLSFFRSFCFCFSLSRCSPTRPSSGTSTVEWACYCSRSTWSLTRRWSWEGKALNSGWISTRWRRFCSISTSFRSSCIFYSSFPITTTTEWLKTPGEGKICFSDFILLLFTSNLYAVSYFYILPNFYWTNISNKNQRINNQACFFQKASNLFAPCS